MVIFLAYCAFGSDEPDGKAGTSNITDADKRSQEYAANAIGRCVPKATAVRTGEALQDEAGL